MYNSNIYNTTINIVTPKIEPKTQSESIKTPLQRYGYINLTQIPYNEYDKYSGSFTPKYKSVLKKSTYNGSNIKTPTNKKITFENKNKIVFIVDKEFYANNNLKHSIWWSAQELMFIRNMVMTEAVRIQRNNPNLNIAQCVKEICKYS
jgi:hypothetical protein